jgi:hypothetical protein
MYLDSGGDGGGGVHSSGPRQRRLGGDDTGPITSNRSRRTVSWRHSGHRALR